MRSSRRLDVTEDAEDDLRSILEYTLATWGERQRDVYAARIDLALDELIQHPYWGRPRDDLSPGLRSRLVEKHVVYYRVDDDVVTITRILHEKMDAASHLRP